MDISEKIKLSARRLQNHYGTFMTISAEDIEQDMHLYNIERKLADPDFEKQSVSYQMQAMEWAAMHSARKEIIYNKYHRSDYVESQDYQTPNTPDEEYLSSILDVIPSSQYTIGQHEEIMMIQAATEGLDAICQKIVEMLYEGFTQIEIAKELEVTPAAISQKKKHIAATMKPLLAAE